MTAPWDTLSDQRIELVCAYVKDDQRVANYFGIDRRRVEHIRATMTAHLRKPRWLHRSPQEGTHSSNGVNSHLVAADDAEVGSRRLNERIQGLFRKFATTHGVTEDEARILLLDTGVRL